MNKPDRVDLELARKRLLIIWGCGAVILLPIVALQATLGRFENFTTEFFGWFNPTIFPTLGLMIGVITSTASEDDSGRTVKGFFFRAAEMLSIVYLIALLGVLLLEPIAGSHDMKYFNISSLWLSAIQGLVVIALGGLFNSRKKTDGDSKAAPEEG
jgi:hypothetical protein